MADEKGKSMHICIRNRAAPRRLTPEKVPLAHRPSGNAGHQPMEATSSSPSLAPCPQMGPFLQPDLVPVGQGKINGAGAQCRSWPFP